MVCLKGLFQSHFVPSFINDLPLHTNAMPDFYADDTTLYEIRKSKEEIERKLLDASNAILMVASWCKQNGMVINIDKTEAMLITTWQRKSRIHDNIAKSEQSSHTPGGSHQRPL